MRIVVTDPIHEVGLDRLTEAGFTVDMATDFSGSLSEAVSTAEVLIVRSGTTLSADVLDACPELRLIARAGIGVDNIDVDAATSAGIQVVNAPTGGIDSVTEHTVAMAYALIRALPWTDRQTRRGEWPKRGYRGSELVEHTIGVVGLGRIGRSVVERANRLGIEVVGYDPFVDEDEIQDLDVRLCPLLDCVKAADILSIHLPRTTETEGLIDASVLSHLEGGFLINCSRGGIVDEDALVHALESGDLAGAAIDVFEDEPITADHPLVDCERTLLTPHVAGTSDRAQRTIATDIADQIIAFSRGDTVAHPVNSPTG